MSDRLFRGVLPRVPEQVGEDNSHEPAVATGTNPINDIELNLARRFLILKTSDHTTREFGQINHLLLERGAANLGQLQ